MLIHNQHFYERYTGERHTVVVIFDYRSRRKCYDVILDGEFYSTAENKYSAFNEIADIVKYFNWSPIRPF